MDKEKILDYVMNSPQNTNRAVLSSMLDSMGGGGSSTKTITLKYGTEGAWTTVTLGDGSTITPGNSLEIGWGVGSFIYLEPSGRYSFSIPQSDKYKVYYRTPGSYYIALIEILSNDIDELVFTTQVDD